MVVQLVVMVVVETLIGLTSGDSIMAYVTRGKSTAQTAVIYDALSEGPIEGLVNGAASIRLDKNPVIGDN